MGKKTKKKQQDANIPNIASIQGDLLRSNEGRDYRSVIIGDPSESTYESRSKFRLHKRDEERVLEAVMKPGRLKIDNKGYSVVKFDDGSTEKYEITDIILMMADLADSHINRFYLTTGAYLSAHRGIDIVSPSVNTGDEEQRIDVDKMVISLYDAYNKDQDESEERREAGICVLFENLLTNDFTAAIYMWEHVKRICRLVEPTRSIIPHIIDAEKIAIQFCDKVDEVLGRDKTSYKYMYQLITRENDGIELVKQKYNAKPYTDDEIVSVLTDIYSREEIRDFMKAYGAYILDRKGVIRQLVNKRMFSEEELHDLINQASAFICYAETGNKEILKYLGVNELVSLYHMGKLEMNQIIRYTTLEQLLMSTISKESKMEILMSGNGERVYGKTETAILWELYEKDYFMLDEIKELESVRYLHVNTVIKNYFADKKRKIAAEFDIIPAITEKKLLEFFTPDIVLREIRAGVSADVKDFYMKDLKEIYEAAGRDLEQELSDLIIATLDPANTRDYLDCMKLYNEGFLSAETLKKINIPESIVLNDYVNGKSDGKLIDFFNASLLSQDTVIDLLDEDFDERSFELIKEGMSARIIQGFYSTAQLVAFTSNYNYAGIPVEPKLTLEQLAEIKEDIDTGLNKDNTQSGKKITTLLDLYLDGTISYTDLYDMEAAGVISKEEADEINDHFNLDQGVAALERIGVSGQPLGNLFKPTPLPGPKPTPKPSPSPKRSAIGIDPKYIIAFYTQMGAKNVIQINGDDCPVFDGYVIIPIIDKKIGFLEGDDGRTYILPLKIILEQINNPKGQMDLIGNATSRNAFNRFKQYVRSTNHTKNWIENTVTKAAEISPVMTDDDVKTFKKNNARLIKAARQDYDYRKANPII